MVHQEREGTGGDGGGRHKVFIIGGNTRVPVSVSVSVSMSVSMSASVSVSVPKQLECVYTTTNKPL